MRILLFVFLLVLISCQKEQAIPEQIYVQDTKSLAVDTFPVGTQFLSEWYKKKDVKKDLRKHWSHSFQISYENKKRSSHWLYDSLTGEVARANNTNRPRYKITNLAKFNKALFPKVADSSLKESLYDLLGGTYTVIGRLPDSDTLYEAEVVVQRCKDHLEVSRVVGDSVLEGMGYLEKSVMVDHIMQLQVDWDGILSEEDHLPTATYLISYDLDNYPRLTGYLYARDNSTKKVGLETWFYDNGQLEKE